MDHDRALGRLPLRLRGILPQSFGKERPRRLPAGPAPYFPALRAGGQVQER